MEAIPHHPAVEGGEMGAILCSPAVAEGRNSDFFWKAWTISPSEAWEHLYVLV